MPLRRLFFLSALVVGAVALNTQFDDAAERVDTECPQSKVGALIEFDVFNTISTWVNDILHAFRNDAVSRTDFIGLKNSELQDIAYRYGATKEEVDAALDEIDPKAALVDLVLTKVPAKECNELCRSVREKWAAVKEAAGKCSDRLDGMKEAINDKVGRMAQYIALHAERAKNKVVSRAAETNLTMVSEDWVEYGKELMKKTAKASKDWVEYGKEQMKKASDASKDWVEYGKRQMESAANRTMVGDDWVEHGKEKMRNAANAGKDWVAYGKEQKKKASGASKYWVEYGKRQMENAANRTMVGDDWVEYGKEKMRNAADAGKDWVAYGKEQMKKVRDASKDWVEYGKERMNKTSDAGKDRDEYGTVRNRWIHQCELRMSDVPDQVDSDQSLLEHCAAKGNSSISPETLNCLQTFKDDPSAVGLVLKNASIGDLPADPNQASRQAKWSAAVVTQFFGMPVGYEELATTTTFKYIYSPPIDNKTVDGPQQSFVGNYTTDDSDRVYGWHIENMAHPLMPGVVVMLCLKPDLEKTAETLFLPAEDVVNRLSDKSKKVLQEFRFKLQIEDTLDLDGVKEIPYAMPVLKQDSDGAWHIYLDGSFTRPLDEEAKEALAELLEVAESAFVGVKLDKGDVLVWKNSRAAHDVRNRGSDRRLLRLHAFTGSDSPFEKFQGWPAQFVKATTEPNVMATRGMFTAEENCLPHIS